MKYCDMCICLSSGESIVYRTLPVYSDLTYQLSAKDSRPNPRVISNTVLSGPSGLPSYRNHTVLFAYFGTFTFRQRYFLSLRCLGVDRGKGGGSRARTEYKKE